MRKATQKKTAIEIVSLDDSHDTVPPVPEPVFSTGELGQLQEILFGQQQRSTHENMSLLREQFSHQLLCISKDLNSRIDKLTDSIEKYRQHFNQQVDDLSKNHQLELSSVNKAVGLVSTELQVDILALSKSAEEESRRLDTKLAQSESTLICEIKETQRALQAEIKGSIDSLDGSKLDTQNLAQLLSDVSTQLVRPSTSTPK